LTPRQAVERLLIEGIDRSRLRSLPLESDKIADPGVLGDVQGLHGRLQRNTEH
jgi:hypothetical protein